ncbi:hypothetical protein KSC_030380 [Ktedonobacter sp. SOSP1-52]|uniref:hypothetical protein n=1 Tax=Ktedonobacter sp. SOSP1-52 TaxID=2778366 RepID=UPI0019164014|nr:hypothetical protein [Ktedonobacter sp. SOSP1-52]GHO64146.1 hypothetical protein KSC_030380 [Ktedonobacter sp. SOSP1-52]
MSESHALQLVPPEIQDVWDALGEERMAPFFHRLAGVGRRQIPLSSLWAIFAEVFPLDDLTGVQRRSWLLALLLKGVREEVMSFPSPRGQNWDRAIQPPLPLWVRVRENPERARLPPARWRSHPWVPQLDGKYPTKYPTKHDDSLSQRK